MGIAGLRDRIEFHLVASDLFTNHVVPRAVTIERVDDVIAIPPCLGLDQTAKGDRFGVAGDVEPMPRETLGKISRSEHPVDDRFVFLRLILGGQKRFDLFGARRQTGQVDR